MKKVLLSLILLAFGLNVIGQVDEKLSDEMRKQLTDRPAANEQFRIIIHLTDEYDQVSMASAVKYMPRAERRSYVISELQRFAEASQYNLKQMLDDGTRSGSVKEVTPFWIFNGISCITTREMIYALSERRDVAFIESDEIRNMLPENEKPGKVMEPTRGLAWHVSQVHANDVWNLGYDGTGIVVAIIDTGVNYNHADVADHMWNGGSQYPHHGKDFVNNDNDPMDDNGHGSHCAGITAGDGTSGTQTGIAPNATIMALKVLSANGSGSNTAITNAEQFAMEHGADVVSMSLGASGASGSKSDRQVFVNMMNAGIVASIAAGNDGEYYSSSHHTTNNYNQSVYYAVPKNVGSPGNCPPPWHNPDQTLTGGLSAVITIGASNRNDRKSTFSSFGPVTWSGVSEYNDYAYTSGSNTNIGLIKPDIIVPGTDITSLLYSDNSSYVEECGTSMATPLASGIMALMLQVNPNLTPAQIDEILETTALPVDYRITKNNYTGAGRGDALAAIDAILTQATKPTNLSLETCGGNVNLSWTASTAPAGYCIYRDNVQVGTTTETTYIDENVGTGKHVYYVRANDNNGRQSVHSNALLCTIEPYATIPEDLTIGWDGTNADLDWEESIVSNTLEQADLCFCDDPYTAFGGKSTTLYWGVCFNPEELRAYKGMSINQVSIPVYTTGIVYTLRIYRGTTYGNTTGTPVYSQSFTPTSGDWEYQSMTLNTPYTLDDISQDLWLTFSATTSSSGGYPLVVGQYDGPSSNCFYLGDGASVNDMCWSHMPDFGAEYEYAVCIKAHLIRTTNYTPTYNVYLDNNSKANNLSATSYTDQPSLHSGNNTYTVTAKVGDNESCPSNNAKIVVIDNTQTANDLSIDESLVYILKDNGLLTVNNVLTSTNPNRLIIEDGAQLIHNSANVQATLQKNIAAYTDKGGWYTIATPFVSYDPALALASSDYDLYAYNEEGNAEGMEWINYKAGAFQLMVGAGYLYAHKPASILSLTGTLNSGSYSRTVNLGYANEDNNIKGFNLLGNPTAHEITFSKSQEVSDGYYYLNNDESWNYTTSNSVPVGSGFLVKANATNQSVTINPQSKDNDQNVGEYLKISVGDNCAYVKLNEGVSMPLLDLNRQHSGLYFTHEQKSYIMLVRDNASSINLCYEPHLNGSQTLVADTKGLSLDYLHLIDNMTGADVDLLQNSSYTFESKMSDYASRFKLVFNANASSDSESFAYFNGNSWIVNNEGKATLQVIDMLGHILSSETINGNAEKKINAAPGVYMLCLINDDNVRVQKIIIK